MGYNHVHPAVNLAGLGTSGRSPVFQGAHLNPMFSDGFAHVPFSPATPAMQKAGCGWYLASVPVEGGGQPTQWFHLESLEATLVLSWFTQVMGQCCQAAPTLRQVRVALQPSAASKIAATGAKRRREDGRESETDDDLDNEDTVHLLD